MSTLSWPRVTRARQAASPCGRHATETVQPPWRSEAQWGRLNTTGLVSRAAGLLEVLMHTTGERRVCPGRRVGKALVSWMEVMPSSWGEERAASGTVRAMPESGRARRAPAADTVHQRVKGELGRRREELGRCREQVEEVELKLDTVAAFLEGLRASPALKDPSDDEGEVMVMVRKELRRQEGIEAQRLKTETLRKQQLDETCKRLEKEISQLEEEKERAKTSCFDDETMTQLNIELRQLRSSVIKRKVLREWLELVRRRQEDRIRTLQREEVMEVLRERMKSR